MERISPELLAGWAKWVTDCYAAFMILGHKRIGFARICIGTHIICIGYGGYNDCRALEGDGDGN